MHSEGTCSTALIVVRGKHKHGMLKGVFVFSMCFLLFAKHNTNILYVKFLALILTVDSYSKAIPAESLRPSRQQGKLI